MRSWVNCTACSTVEVDGGMLAGMSMTLGRLAAEKLRSLEGEP
jgi:hypothetical protein